MMSQYNWCHNPKCHTYQTTDRIRGVKGSKVLRTRKIAINKWNEDNVWSYFCNNQCLFSYLRENLTAIINIAPVHEPSETPIDVKVENRDTFRHIYNHEHSTYERVPHVEKVKTIIAK